MRVNTYAVALENMILKHPRPVTPAATVRSPKLRAESAAAVDRMPFTATAIVTTLAPPVLSIYRSKTVPLAAPRAAPNSVPVGSVMVVRAAEVEVMKPVATWAAVAVAVALIAAVVAWVVVPVPAMLPVIAPIKPLVEVTGPEKVVEDIRCSSLCELCASVCKVVSRGCQIRGFSRITPLYQFVGEGSMY